MVSFILHFWPLQRQLVAPGGGLCSTQEQWPRTQGRVFSVLWVLGFRKFWKTPHDLVLGSCETTKNVEMKRWKGAGGKRSVAGGSEEGTLFGVWGKKPDCSRREERAHSEGVWHCWWTGLTVRRKNPTLWGTSPSLLLKLTHTTCELIIPSMQSGLWFLCSWDSGPFY